MRAIKYFFTEAAARLWRGRSAAALAVLTIAVGLFVLGLFLALNGNLQRLVGRWTESAELSVYLKEDASPDQLRTIDDLVAGSGVAAHREYVSKTQAAARFRQDFPDLAGATARLESNPFPASIEVRLKPEARDAGAAGGKPGGGPGGAGGGGDARGGPAL